MEKYTETIANGITFTMLPIQGGNFMMGSNDYNNAKPIHRVTVPDFYLCEHLVTQAVWQAIMGKNPSRFSGCDQCPVEQVSWDDIQKFLQKLNALTGKIYRLPTEAEWEYAARGGNQSKGYKYAGSDYLDKVGYYDRNSKRQTQPVGQLYPNELGLYDMSGNVWEWCQDEWHGNYQGAPTDGSAWQEKINIQNKNTIRVIRGGSWISNPNYCRVADRLRYSDHYANDNFGCRLAWCPTL